MIEACKSVVKDTARKRFPDRYCVFENLLRILFSHVQDQEQSSSRFIVRNQILNVSDITRAIDRGGGEIMTNGRLIFMRLKVSRFSLILHSQAQ